MSDDELRAAEADLAAFKRDLAQALGLAGTKPSHWPKPRRPARWKGGSDGYELVAAVLEYQAEHSCTEIAPAIKLLRAKSEKWRAINQRDLERRFQEARRYWEPWWREQIWLEARLKKIQKSTETM